MGIREVRGVFSVLGFFAMAMRNSSIDALTSRATVECNRSEEVDLCVVRIDVQRFTANVHGFCRLAMLVQITRQVAVKGVMYFGFISNDSRYCSLASSVRPAASSVAIRVRAKSLLGWQATLCAHKARLSRQCVVCVHAMKVNAAITAVAVAA